MTEEEADEFFAEVSKRMELSGKTLEEVIAEIDAEDKIKVELQSDLECYIRIGLQRKATILIVDTGQYDVKRMINDAFKKIGGINLGDIANIKINRYENCTRFWQHLLNLRQDILWAIWDGVESVTDEYIQQCIFYMLKREEYTPPSLHAEPIDFSKRQLIFIVKANDIEALPQYCKGHSLNTVIVRM